MRQYFTNCNENLNLIGKVYRKKGIIPVLVTVPNDKESISDYLESNVKHLNQFIDVTAKEIARVYEDEGVNPDYLEWEDIVDWVSENFEGSRCGTISVLIDPQTHKVKEQYTGYSFVELPKGFFFKGNCVQGWLFIISPADKLNSQQELEAYINGIEENIIDIMKCIDMPTELVRIDITEDAIERYVGVTHKFSNFLNVEEVRYKVKPMRGGSLAITLKFKMIDVKAYEYCLQECNALSEDIGLPLADIHFSCQHNA